MSNDRSQTSTRHSQCLPHADGEMTQGETMSPETRSAVAAGKVLTKTQYREYVEHEARAAGLRSTAEATERLNRDEPPANYREMRVRMLLAQL